MGLKKKKKKKKKIMLSVERCQKFNRNIWQNPISTN